LWPIIIAIICLPVVILATGVSLPGIGDAPASPRPQSLPDGDQELAWIHTTTSATTWERFVSGMMRTQMNVPGLQIDDSHAFQDSTTAVPELVLSMQGRTGKLHIRWYKIRSDVTAADWIRALAARDPAPLAIIGGGSTDRAVDLSKALNDQNEWRGDRPLLLITTATADKIASPEDPPGSLPTRPLIDLYPDRSFRFCFTNRQMAEAVLDFVWENPDLRPQSFVALARLAAGSGAIAVLPQAGTVERFRPHVLSVLWDDDPYSTDLHRQFTEAARDISGGDDRIIFSQWHVPFSVGGFLRANLYEARTAESLARQLRESTPQRMLLVVPAITQPARRLLQAVSQASILSSQRLVVVTGDGIPVNAIYRDGEFAWPTSAIDMPLVLFTHNNPLGWDDYKNNNAPEGYELRPPTSTEDALHFRDLGAIVAQACYPTEAEQARFGTRGGLIARANDLQLRFHERSPVFFNTNGERRGGTGEYVVVLRPREDAEVGNLLPVMSAWKREADRSWTLVRSMNVDPRKIGRAGELP